MDVELVRTFLAVAHHRNFSAAGRDLAIVQSAVTARIHLVEKAVGARLFDRNPKHVTLTQHGLQLLEPARSLVDAEERFLAALRDERPTGRIGVAAPESICAYRLPPLVADLAATFPGLEVHIIPAGTEVAMEHLLQRRCDLALSLDPPAANTRLSTERLGTEEVGLWTAAEAPPPGTFDEVASGALFLLEEGCSYSDQFLATLRSETGENGRTTRFSSLEAVKSCIAAGLGPGVLPQFSIQAHDNLVRAAIPVPDAEVFLTRESARWLSPGVAAVAAALRALWRDATG
ncbi:LysR family transcriptional regulator [Intrasporangium sp.]|uniref:LysR family transcriptional regulator n=1 Tax=Intrasporangium sp. TaxID=1925024 RepID=UPI0029396289|nr:LysR family transcriptional regulator [Intrasporangium sp.]MDV3223319.1 LysR family transcriptional regulator [Intrasporangium sp.]